jgi:hypothetical protein
VFKAKNFDLTIVSHTEPMDIGIYARDDYYFQYGDADFKAIMADLANATDPAKRTELMQAAQKKIADDYVNGYLFQLARAGVQRQAQGHLAQFADPGQRHDRRLLGRVSHLIIAMAGSEPGHRAIMPLDNAPLDRAR